MSMKAARPEINIENVCFVIIKAREFDVQVGVEDPDYGSDATDDKFVQILESYADNPTFAELRSFIEAMNEEDQIELVALAWTGRGDFEPDEWGEALLLAKERHSGSTTLYLCGMPTLGDYLEEGLAAFGLSCAETEQAHL